LLPLQGFGSTRQGGIDAWDYKGIAEFRSPAYAAFVLLHAAYQMVKGTKLTPQQVLTQFKKNDAFHIDSEPRFFVIRDQPVVSPPLPLPPLVVSPPLPLPLIRVALPAAAQHPGGGGEGAAARLRCGVGGWLAA
jgi:hypothetical protein